MSLEPCSAAAADEGLDKRAGNLLLMGWEQWWLIAVYTLKWREAGGRAEKGIVSIFNSQ